MTLPELPLNPGTVLWVQVIAIVLATFVSEDLTCIGVGLLVRQGEVNPIVGLVGCVLGIFAGDLGLWLTGRALGLGLLKQTWVRGLLPMNRLEELGRWFDRRGWVAVFAARFLPGTRLPLYVAAGVLGRNTWRYILWTALAVLIWTPILILATVVFGPIIQDSIGLLFGPGLLALLGASGVLYLVTRSALLLSTRTGRGKLLASVARLWRWEFWPSWLFYLPLIPWLAYLSLRHRGILVWTAANPGIPHGGVVGESKHDIQSQLPAPWVIPTFLVPAGELTDRLDLVQREMISRGWAHPIIIKPDAAQRGAGVKLSREPGEVESYLRTQPAAVVVQPYHPGPFEAGIFYYRLPGEKSGRIFSITDKHFPVLVGDGTSTIEELIWSHPRYRMQAETFLARHEAMRQRILDRGERLALALAGNHCQGTLFRDGSHLLTPELEWRVDAIARAVPGFFIGRFDVRYSSVEDFKAGKDLAIVELNGVTSESTNIYDPSWSLFAAYRTLFHQWSLLYRIGAANRRLGQRPATIGELVWHVFTYYRHRQVNTLAD